MEGAPCRDILPSGSWENPAWGLPVLGQVHSVLFDPFFFFPSCNELGFEVPPNPTHSAVPCCCALCSAAGGTRALWAAAAPLVSPLLSCPSGVLVEEPVMLPQRREPCSTLCLPLPALPPSHSSAFVFNMRFCRITNHHKKPCRCSLGFLGLASCNV